jgi:hypothetical protein
MASSIQTDWLNSCKETIKQSSEWRSISNTVYSYLQETLAQDRAGFFSDLSPAEQSAYMNRVEQKLVSLDQYPMFMQKLNNVVDQAVANVADNQTELNPEQEEQTSTVTTTRLDRILQCTAVGAAVLLKSNPDGNIDETFHKLQVLKNVSLPPALRNEVNDVHIYIYILNMLFIFDMF